MTATWRRLPLAVLTLALALAPRAEATLMKAATFDEKVENAASVVLGTVVKKESRWDDNHRWILTYTTFRVEKTMKGIAVPAELTIVTPGGAVGGVHQETVGVPDFDEGSEHVLFVKNTRLGPTVLYFDQGAYDVEKNERGDRIVTPVASEAVTVDTQRGMAVAPESPRTLDDFEHAVRDSARRAVVNRMEMLRRQAEAAEPPLWSTLDKWFIALALLGGALATWHFARRG